MFPHSMRTDRLLRMRIESQNKLLKQLCGLHVSPIVNPQIVLDIGTGAGNWALEFGKLFENNSLHLNRMLITASR
jgi:ubiquinone/menaquinone biosynthesis C-methylase UbiE